MIIRQSGRTGRFALFALLALFAVTGGTVHAQEADTTAVPLRPVVVTVERAPWPISSSTAAVSRLSAEEMAAFPQTTLADALRQVPGIAVMDFSGDGTAPQVIVRGFYGGGEAEYVVVLLNGKPLNDVHTGLVRWDAIPAVAIDRIEVVRGGASALYGDAAIGAVVNVITKEPVSGGPPSWSVAGGSNTAMDASLYVGESLFGRPVAVFAGLDRSEGFRDHSERTLARLGGTYTLAAGPAGAVKMTALGHWRDYQTPGPLLGPDLEADRASSDVFYRFDSTRENSQRLAIDAERWLGTGVRLDASVGGDRRGMDAVRTVALAPTFADTKLRQVTTTRAVGSVQFTMDETLLPGADRFVVGVDGSYGGIDSEYLGVLTGTRNDYRDATGQPGAPEATGTGTRANASAFAEYTILPSDAVRLSLGVRADWLSDDYQITRPTTEDLSASHTAISPKAGLNVRWLDMDNQTGHVYFNAGRSFKAPTLDQLFDQRIFPVPFPPFAVTTSNALLEPQYGTQFEAGLYHSAVLVPGVLSLDASLAGYRMDMEDEIDFDLATLSYVNIAESRHTGLEGSLRLISPGGVSIYLTGATQSVTARNDENHGNQLKAVPRHIVNAGASVRPMELVQVALGVSHTRGIHLDDANTIELPPFTSVDSRLEVGLLQGRSGGSIFLDFRNLLNANFSTTGYPDPGASGADAPVYFFPAAGRTVRLGLQVGR